MSDGHGQVVYLAAVGIFGSVSTRIDMAGRLKPKDIDAYIASFPPAIRAILRKLRATIRRAAPRAEEKISYGIPAFTLDGRTLIYFAAFKNHIGIYPPVRGDAKLIKRVKRYQGSKGNLQLPLDEAMPYNLIERIVKSRADLHLPVRAKRRA
jgi:uncharacterized protein YdhG (YjbR/CyaY superfamily)